MTSKLLGFLELFIVFGFLIGLGVIELVALRQDKRRKKAERAAETSEPPTGTAS